LGVFVYRIVTFCPLLLERLDASATTSLCISD